MLKARSLHSIYRNIFLMKLMEFSGSLRFYYPITVILFEKLLGSYTAAMIVIATIEAVRFILEIPTGILSDKIGRRLTMVCGAGSEVIGTILYALSFYNPHLLYAGAFFFGVGGAFYSGNNEAMIYETLASCRRTKLYPIIHGQIQAMEQFGLCITGVVTTFILYIKMPEQTVMLLTLVTITIALIGSLFLIDPPSYHKTRGALTTLNHFKVALLMVLRHKNLRLLTIGTVIRTGSGNAVNSFVPGYVATVWPLWLTPMFRTLLNGIGVICYWFINPIVRRYSMLQILTGANIYSTTLGLLAYTVNNALSPFIILSQKPANTLRMTATSTLQQQMFSDEYRSTMGSVISLFGSIFSGLCLVLVGWLADHIGPANAMIVMILMGVPTIFIYSSLFSREDKLTP